MQVLNLKMEKKGFFPPSFVPASLTLLQRGLGNEPSPLFVELVPCPAGSSRQRKKPIPTRQCSDFHQTSGFYRKSIVVTFPSPPFPLWFSPARVSPHFPAGWGTGVDAPRDAKHDPGILLDLGLSRAGFQEGRSPSQAVVDDRSGAFRSGSQRGR